LTHLRSKRNDELALVAGDYARGLAEAADAETAQAIQAERRALASGKPTMLRQYEAISAAKQAVGLPATLALARAVGWGEGKANLARAALMGTWLGLQFQDDVVDWEEDACAGGAWAVALAVHRIESNSAKQVAPRSTNLDDLKALVFSTGVLADMLERSVAQFRAGHSAAQELGSETLAAWLCSREREALDFWRHEQGSPGYVVRMKALHPWASEVLG
jgi:hypothetical protein